MDAVSYNFDAPFEYFMIKKKRETSKVGCCSPRLSYEIHFRLNKSEYKALEQYCKKFRIRNRSKWIRETLMTHIFEEYYSQMPCLFDIKEMQNHE
ncbi:Uncharacterised protein [Porphyromonas macacae]|uniref:Uncharacterized protein n=2 Tax=Porphyromonas macacae TaxID=28115 RepID=A0A379DJ05_9PORP|nr:Uncharacterised protein [Porphyromonas macacae]